MNNTNIIAQKCSKRAQEVVLQLIETTVSTNELQNLCCFITPGQLEDVFLERCIAGICGYPLCKKAYRDKYGSQQYVIRNKAVYDITNRRNFCSNVCFEASLRLLSQIPSSPLYLRGQVESERLSIVIPDLSQLKGLYGDKVNIGNSKPLSDTDIGGIPKSSAKKQHTDSEQRSNNPVNGSANHRRRNKSKNLASDQCVLHQEEVAKSGISSDSAVKKNSSSGGSAAVEGNLAVENSSTEDEVGTPAPAPEGDARVPLPPHRRGGVEPLNSSRAATTGSSPDDGAVSQVEEHLRQWLRWPSYILLLGEKNLHVRCGLAAPTSADDEDSSFAERSARIRSIHAATLAKVSAFYKGADGYTETPEDEQVESGLPLVDQHNISSWRRNIFLQKLAPCEQCLVARLRLPREEVRQKLKAVLLTLHLTQHNLHLRPAQWALVALVLLKLISVSCSEVREAFMDDGALHAEVLPRLAMLDMTLQDLDALVARVLEPPVLRKAYLEYQKSLPPSPRSAGCDGSLPKASEEVDFSSRVENEVNDRSESPLPNIETLSVKVEDNSTLADVHDQSIYSQIEALD